MTKAVEKEEKFQRKHYYVKIFEKHIGVGGLKQFILRGGQSHP